MDYEIDHEFLNEVDNQLILLLFWDNRQDPEKLSLLMTKGHLRHGGNSLLYFN